MIEGPHTHSGGVRAHELGETPQETKCREGQDKCPQAVHGKSTQGATTLRPQHSGLRVAGRASSLGHHHLDELLVVDLAITVHISLADHLIDLLVGELLAEVRLTWRSSAALMKP